MVVLKVLVEFDDNLVSGEEFLGQYKAEFRIDVGLKSYL